MRNYDLGSGLLCLLIGLGFIAGGVKMGLGPLNVPGAGFFPTVIGGILSALSAALLINAAFGKNPAMDKQRFWEEKSSWVKVSRALLSLIFYMIFLEFLGYIITTIIFVFFLLKFVGKKGLGKPVVVVNKPGGGGLVGFKQIAAAKPDGYTVGINTNSQILQKYSASSYLDWRVFSPIALHNYDPAAFTVKVDAPWKTIEEALAFAKANPMKMRVSNSGPGAIWHVAAALLGSKAGVQFTHVPYGGGNPAAVAVAGGHVEATTASPAEVGTLVKGGKLRILAIAANKREPLFPDVPTFQERKIDFTFGVWRCLVAPKDTPKEIIARLEKSANKAAHDPRFMEFMTKNGFGQAYMGPAESAALMAQDEKDMEKVVPGLGLKKN